MFFTRNSLLPGTVFYPNPLFYRNSLYPNPLFYPGSGYFPEKRLFLGNSGYFPEKRLFLGKQWLLPGCRLYADSPESKHPFVTVFVIFDISSMPRCVTGGGVHGWWCTRSSGMGWGTRGNGTGWTRCGPMWYPVYTVRVPVPTVTPLYPHCNHCDTTVTPL